MHENLTAVQRLGRNRAGSRRWDPQRVYEMFPRLAERKTNLGTQLSGGEQQMLAVGSALPGLLAALKRAETASVEITRLVRARGEVLGHGRGRSVTRRHKPLRLHDGPLQ